MFKHYLLLRYNLTLFSTNVYNVADPDRWMNKRLPKFFRLLESLKAQTHKDFTLVVGVDYDTPDSYIKDIVDYLDLSGVTYHLVYEQPSEWLKRREKESEWLITSRIDNDDEYLPSFIGFIQQAFREKEEVLDVYGMQCLNGELYSSGRPHANSPFITLVERWDLPKTVHYKAHSVMNGEYPARFVGTNPLYIQHIHDNNIMNKIIGKKL